MATVFMKWLETSPKDYDRGIQLLTLGKIRAIEQQIVHQYVRENSQVLEIGCGTGTLTTLMAQQGATVTAIDASPGMLAEAKKKIATEHLQERVHLRYMDATLIGETFQSNSFDLIVSTLVFSELPEDERRFVLAACTELLAPGGQLLIADEVVPTGWLRHFLYYLVRIPLVLLTWLLTRTTTKALNDFSELLTEAGFQCRTPISYLGGSIVLFESMVAESPAAYLQPAVPRLTHRRTLKTLLTDLWELFFRIIPPYPRVKPGLYAVGRPGPDSPVLVTGNFDLTVRRLAQAIDNRIDAWVLVADSAGINVWCAAGGGYFTAEKVIAAVKSTQLAEVVDHHRLILPQLCANGVDGWRIRQETGWGVHWGPVRAEAIPSYLASNGKKTEAMRWVRFPLKDRLEMVTVTLGFYALLILIPVIIFWRDIFWPVAISLIALSYFYAVVHPWLPGRDGLWKSISLTVIALGGLLTYSTLINALSAPQLFKWAIGLTGLSVFTAAELQGMSPLMRGEQANWSAEALIGGGLLLVYFLVPWALGW